MVAVRGVVEDEQKVFPKEDIEAMGLGFAVVVTEDEVAVHPLALVTVTENVPDVVMLIDCVVAPLLQR